MVCHNRFAKIQGKVILIWIAVLLVCVLMYDVRSYAVTSYQISGGNYVLMTDNVNVYAVRYNGNEINASIVKKNECRNVTFSVLGTVKNLTVNNNYIYALSADSGKIVLNQYSVKNDSVYHYTLDTDSINSAYRFCVSDDRVCFMTNDIADTFVCLNLYGEKVYSFSVGEEIIDYTINNSDGQFYLFGRNNIYRTDIRQNANPECILSTVDMRTGITISDNVIFDYSGNMTDMNTKTFLSSKIQGERNGCMINGHYCKYTNGGIEVFESEDCHYVAYPINYGMHAQMCSKDNVAYLLSDSGKLAVVSSEEFTFRQYEEDTVVDDNPSSLPDNHSSTVNPVTNNPSQNTAYSNRYSSAENINDDEEFSINGYRVDADRNIIWDIPDGTTIAVFKKNITKGHYQLEFRNKNNTVKTSGKLGTGYTMAVKDGDAVVEIYRISVKAELTGEGNVNFNDLKLQCYYVMRCGDLDDLQYVASDLNYDGLVDSRDIMRLARKINL